MLDKVSPYACVFQEALTGGDGQERGTIGRTIEWNGLRAALDGAAVHPQRRATTEEAFTLLVKFGQAPSCGSLLEPFAMNAEKLRSRTLLQAPPLTGLRMIPVIQSGGDRSHEPDPSDGGVAIAVAASPGPGKDDEASSVLLEASEIAALAVELDPMRRIDSAFASVAEAFGGDYVSSAVGSSVAGRRQRGKNFRSPLHSYAVSRRCSRWRNKLEIVGSCLATTRRRLGRRGQNLLVLRSELAEAMPPSGRLPSAAVSGGELIAQAKAVTAKAARRQEADEAGRGSGRGAFWSDHESGAILSARIHRHAPLLERSARGVQAFVGRGCYHGGTAASPKEGTGEPVAVLEASTALCGKEVSAEIGATGNTGVGHGPRITGENLAFVASVLSVRVLRDHPGLLKIHSEAVTVEDGRSGKHQGTITDGRREEDYESDAGGVGPTPLRPVQIVCERLGGWRPLCDVILEHGHLVTPSGIEAGDGGEGLRVLRLWGGQLGGALECLASMSLVLRDLRASTVFVSPDGSAVKVVGFFSLTTVSSEGETVPPEAPDLDDSIHGPTEPLTPPEALAISRRPKNGGRSDNNDSLAGSPQHGAPSYPLVLAGKECPGEFPTTAKWDIWTLGVLLFQLAFGHPPPAYGDCLRQGISSLNFDTSTAACRANGAPDPSVSNMLSTIQYDFLSAVGGQIEGGRPGQAFTASHVGDSPLERALECMSLGAAIGERDTFHVVSAPGKRKLSAAECEVGGRDGGRKTVERFRRAWVRRQLQMEERGETDVMTWQAFQEKLKRHLDVSVAPAATVETATPLCWQDMIPQGGGDDGGGRRRANFVGPDDHPATPPSSRRQTGRAAAEDAFQRTAVRLRAADPRGTGRIPFSVARGTMCDEIQLAFSASEAELLKLCLQDAGGSESNGGSRGDDCNHRNVNDNRGGQVRREEERDVCYQPLVRVLRALSLPTGAPALEPPRLSFAGDDLFPLPTPTAFVEVLCGCLEPSPDRRLCALDLLRLPFFSGAGSERGPVKNTNDLQAASAYLGGSGNELSPALALRELVECRVQALEAACVHGAPIIDNEKKRRAAAARIDGGGGCSSTNVGAGALVEALKELEHLLRRSSPTAHYLTEDGHPRQARRVARGHARVVDEIFESGVLMRASALALRFLDREEVCKCASPSQRQFALVDGDSFVDAHLFALWSF